MLGVGYEVNGRGVAVPKMMPPLVQAPIVARLHAAAQTELRVKKEQARLLASRLGEVKQEAAAKQLAMSNKHEAEEFRSSYGAAAVAQPPSLPARRLGVDVRRLAWLLARTGGRRRMTGAPTSTSALFAESQPSADEPNASGPRPQPTPSLRDHDLSALCVLSAV